MAPSIPLQVPVQIFITDTLPKGPTGKVQRRFMADHFIKAAGGVEKNATAGQLQLAASAALSQGAPLPLQPTRSRL